jgi:hypothetical protein
VQREREIQEIREAGMAANTSRILDAVSLLIPITEVTRLAVRGWLAFVATTILEWLDQPTVTQEELRDLCVRTLFAAVGVTP